MAFPPGHFYSPIPSIAGIRGRADSLFAAGCELPGVQLDTDSQLRVVRTLAEYYAEQPFEATKSPATRYWFENDYFSYGDALMLYGMLRQYEPRRVIEIGSGFSSALMIDTQERYLRDVSLTFVDPYARRLRSVLRPGDLSGRNTLLERPVWEMPRTVFDELGENDILFIDSTHVSKVGSDVNWLLLEVLPRLRDGVIVHLHDIFFPFEYPEEWIYGGRAWNEAYLLRALLIENPHWEVLVFNSYLASESLDVVAEMMPLWGRNTGGSIWLRRVACAG